MYATRPWSGPGLLISEPDESGPYLVVGPSVCSLVSRVSFFGNRLLARGRKGLALSHATPRGGREQVNSFEEVRREEFVLPAEVKVISTPS